MPVVRAFTLGEVISNSSRPVVVLVAMLLDGFHGFEVHHLDVLRRENGLIPGLILHLPLEDGVSAVGALHHCQGGHQLAVSVIVHELPRHCATLLVVLQHPLLVGPLHAPSYGYNQNPQPAICVHRELGSERIVNINDTSQRAIGLTESNCRQITTSNLASPRIVDKYNKQFCFTENWVNREL